MESYIGNHGRGAWFRETSIGLIGGARRRRRNRRRNRRRFEGIAGVDSVAGELA